MHDIYKFISCHFLHIILFINTSKYYYIVCMCYFLSFSTDNFIH